MDTSKSELLCPRHKHKLVWLPSGHRYDCSGCKDQGLNGRYLCRHPDCADSDSDFDFVLHRECAQLPDVYQKPNLAVEELYFHSQTRFRNNCSACKKPIRASAPKDVRGLLIHRKPPATLQGGNRIDNSNRTGYSL
ncbi:hypothetical protein SUGI_0812330 [Cryptomeria japonica]|nr:hypothetical protein SUGI_0812330 [Cryptomeria japonica]